jgi:diguanylate cyclase (GGDEF)-like protein
MRLRIASEPLRIDDRQISVTASFGVAACSDGNPYDLALLLKLGDEALYSAKRAGRNRVEFARAEPAIAASEADSSHPAVAPAESR